MENITIGLLGAVINNPNMGCVALTYSLLTMLENIGKEENRKFTYYVFEGKGDPERINLLCSALKIGQDRIKSFPIAYLYHASSAVHHWYESIKTIKHFMRCDLFIDLTQGDSFTDIYGKARYKDATKIKKVIEKLNVPLILGPQTYGPFSDDEIKKDAIRVIENASCVLARDCISAEYINQNCAKKIYAVTDLAFLLPYEKKKVQSKSDKVKVGINISALLVKNKLENTHRNFELETDYDKYITSLLDYFRQNKKYEVYIIPHVGDDANSLYFDQYPEFDFLDSFDSPIEAKNIISQMDIFIGARMHATIAAVSSGVATIPTAYSRKFKGVFNDLGYKYIVDLQHLTTEDSVKCTLDYLAKYSELKQNANTAARLASEKSELTHSLMKENIEQCRIRKR